MSKRRISQQQILRIKQSQAKRELKAKQNDSTDSSHSLGHEQSGLLISRYGKAALVEDEQGQQHRCLIRQSLGTLVAGDIVTWCHSAQSNSVIVARNERHSVLGRPDKQGNIRPVAANIDQMLIVITAKPMVTLPLLDSYLVAAELLNICPVIVINKSDIDTLPDIASLYQRLGYNIITTSNVNKDGFLQLEAALANKTNVFVGQSGVGKSSLIAELLPSESIAVGAISEQTELGRHTTSNSVLYHTTAGGRLIDSPGIREFGLWHIDASKMIDGFVELRPLKGHCKFRNCGHRHEPGCAIKDALKAGKISPSRLASFQNLLHRD